jgi:N-acyl homoserine lactone hydrolase
MRNRITLGLASAALLVGLQGLMGAMLNAQARPAPPRTVRLYVFDCGVLKIADPMPLFGLKKEEVAATDLADAAYLIVHPRGTLMWEAGLVPDAIIGTVNARPGAPMKPLKAAMAEIGYRPGDITYFAISHGHGDHTANANDFQGSTWLVNRAEYDAMFADNAPRFYTPATYSALKNSKTTFIKDDHDVFGDGTVVIKAAPGHTPGHQVLIVQLASTGRVMIAGDLYHYPPERAFHRAPPDNEFNVQQSGTSRAMIEDYLAKTRTTIWIEHDFRANAKLKKSPAYYD